jgi:type IV pilus assembly protein PilX
MTRALPRERGASLVVALIFLVIMAMLGVTVAGVTGLEQRMASNTRDRDLALQAAEAALHDAETRLADSAFRLKFAANLFKADRANSASFWEDCFTNKTAPCEAAYTFTPKNAMVTVGAGAVADQPAYVVEKKAPIGTTEVYLVTARAVGGTQDAVVVLQAEYGYTPAP